MARAAPLLVLLLLAAPSRPRAAEPSLAAGERIYRLGVLPSGKPLRGEREGGAALVGREAACATCHRRSGLGSYEGQTVIPPIIGRYLLRPGARNVADPDLPHVQGYTPRRDAYDDRTLARAIREGRDPHGRRLGYLMPRYRLDDASTRSLVAYLKKLGDAPEPGVTRDTLHFATVIAPGADPSARKGMLDVLRQFFADKNAGYRGESPPLRSDRGVMYRVNRKWSLHVWELTGPPEGWESQLRARLAAEPVFAIVSGVGSGTWAPVHRFCVDEGIPCLFPNVDLPVDAPDDFYPVYFSGGVLLEARLLASRVAKEREGPVPGRVVQVYRQGDLGADAARALREALPAGTEVVDGPIPVGAPASAVAGSLDGVRRGDALVLWLRPGDQRALPPRSTAYRSSSRARSADWRTHPSRRGGERWPASPIRTTCPTGARSGWTSLWAGSRCAESRWWTSGSRSTPTSPA